jgi:hypothetical protein
MLRMTVKWAFDMALCAVAVACFSPKIYAGSVSSPLVSAVSVTGETAGKNSETDYRLPDSIANCNKVRQVRTPRKSPLESPAGSILPGFDFSHRTAGAISSLGSLDSFLTGVEFFSSRAPPDSRV